MASSRNKTITLTEKEQKTLLSSALMGHEVDEGSFPVDRVIVGDSLSLMERLRPQSVDLLIADPPYNLYKNFGGESFRKADDRAYAAYSEAWLSRILPLLKENASAYICCDPMTGMILAPILKEYFYVRNRITWQREKGRGSKTNWKNAMEDIYFLTRGKEYTFHPERVLLRRKVNAPYKEDGLPKDWQETPDGKFRDTYPGNFWDDLTVPYWSMAENTAHPTQKPEKLLAKLILASSEEGDTVFDPFLGSGTTAVAAKKLGRHFLGVEQVPEYAALAVKRLQLAEEDGRIQGYRDGVFWERNTLAEQKKYGN